MPGRLPNWMLTSIHRLGNVREPPVAVAGTFLSPVAVGLQPTPVTTPTPRRSRRNATEPDPRGVPDP